ncbi:uncharacterized protein J7T54_002841 [Emericellopsis cladophorae]|uniref:Alpha/beta hydrolase fold-3 domain-containing protein n=1 Tax=Emericellopsis cladophorae TaxID=2686198 RepID=A0A9P9XU61_9HYPO|nr:uncharacterized protein J7T54_002841 [Emericellopsis cladophorae]KAI6777805.1 hypothetical protein J7T54_002841 [Emericellopsis cladophorae]
MRAYQCGLGAVQVQNLLPGTSKTCARFAKARGVPHATIHLPDGSTAAWLGPREAKKVVVLFHGGGYMAPALTDHISLAFGFSKQVRGDVAVAVLHYSLASEGANHYPCQLQQAVWLIGHLRSDGIGPSAITLLGDSAGAHLLLSLLFHLVHPEPRVSPLKLDEQFSGAALVSPWINLSTTSTLAQSSTDKDVLEAAALRYWASNFLGGVQPSPWNDQLTAPAEWWHSLPVENILVTYGDNELLRDDISVLCDALKSHPKLTVCKAVGEVHVHMVLNRFLRINKPCESEGVLVEWLERRLTNET